MSQLMCDIAGVENEEEAGLDWDGALRSRDNTWLLWEARRSEAARPSPALPPVTMMFLFLGGLKFVLVIVNASVAIVLG